MTTMKRLCAYCNRPEGEQRRGEKVYIEEHHRADGSIVFLCDDCDVIRAEGSLDLNLLDSFTYRE